jgi:hypothetical protein
VRGTGRANPVSGYGRAGRQRPGGPDWSVAEFRGAG